MMDLDSDELRMILGTAAILRGKGQFENAENLLAGRINEMSDDAKEAAYLQLIYCAIEWGNPEKAKEYATELAKYDPDIPTVRKVLSGQM